MLSRLFVVLAMTSACARAQMDPRASASDYAAHTELKNASIGAENLGHNMSTARGAITVPEYLVIEIAVYSKAITVPLNAGNFRLRVNGKKDLLMAQAPGMVAAALKYGDWETRPALVGTAGPLIIGRPDHASRFPGDPAGPVSSPLPRAPTGGVEKEQPEPVEDVVNHHALPEGNVRPPVSGYLFFPFKGKLKSLKKVDLLYEGPLGAAALLLP